MLRKLNWLFNLTPIAALVMPVVILLVLSLMVQQGMAQPAWNVWSSNGPNEFINSIAIDAIDPNIIYAAGGGSGVFKSLDNGASWRVSNQGLGSSYVTSLAIAPSDPNILFAINLGGVFKTTDGGANWSRTNSPGNTVGPIAVAPSNPNVVYSATQKDLLVTTNGGETWNPRTFPGFGDSMNLLVVDPQNPDTFYASFNNGYETFFSLLLKMESSTWKRVIVNEGGGVDTYNMSIDARNTNIIYIATGYGVYKSTDAGVNWAWRGSPGPNAENTETLALAIDPLNPRTLYVGAFVNVGCFCYTGVYKSTDDGATWSAFNNQLTNLEVRQLAFDRSGRFLHAATGAGVFSVRVREDTAIVSVSGRVTTPDGRGLRNATVTLTDSLGVSRSVTTSSFGFYTFGNVPVDAAYVIGVSSRLYRFASRNLVVNDNLTNVDFVGLE